LDHYLYSSGKKLCFKGFKELEEYAKENPKICMLGSDKWQEWKKEVMMMMKKPLSGTKFRLQWNGFPRKCMAGKLIPKIITINGKK
jgi:hypothetical protein